MSARPEGERGLPWVWGDPIAVPDDVSLPGTRVVTRSVVVEAPAHTVYLWVCQLRRAPYSYDWLDNLGRRSPREPRADLVDPEVGDVFMTIFELTDVTNGESLTMRMRPGRPTRLFGAIALRYVVEALPDGRTRLGAVMWMPPVGRRLARQRRYALAWGDVLMMRKQLRTLAALAEAHE